jgi:hypothetical protein
MIVSSFIIQANVNYDRKTFIVQATGLDDICFEKVRPTISKKNGIFSSTVKMH